MYLPDACHAVYQSGNMVTIVPEYMPRYMDRLEKSCSMTYAELAAYCFGSHYFSTEPALSASEIDEWEGKLGCKLPRELRKFYLELGSLYSGGTPAFLVDPLPEIVAENLDFWSGAYDDCFMPLDGLFVFGGEGNGDKFFFPKRRYGRYGRGVFQWDHESDSRPWIANSITDLIIRSTLYWDPLE